MPPVPVVLGIGAPPVPVIDPLLPLVSGMVPELPGIGLVPPGNVLVPPGVVPAPVPVPGTPLLALPAPVEVSPVAPCAITPGSSPDVVGAAAGCAPQSDNAMISALTIVPPA